MSQGSRLLISGGLLMVLLGMGFGLWYALYDEHQTLGGMGAALASAMERAAAGEQQEALMALERFTTLRFEYVRDVHAHSHWSSLGLLLILLGCAGAGLRYRRTTSLGLVLLLLYGAVAFPLGVMMQPLQAGAIAAFLSISGSLALVSGFAFYAWGLPWRRGGST